MADDHNHSDDSLMARFDERGLRRYRARDAIVVVIAVAVLLALLEGPSVRKAGREMKAGVGRSIVLAVGRPAADASNGLHLARATRRLTAFLSPDASLSTGGGAFSGSVTRGAAGQIPAVTPDSFTAASLGQRPPARRVLHSVLVTGDSMSMPLDADLAQRLVPRGITVTRDPHIGTAISKSDLVDWGRLSVDQVRAHHPGAVVMFLGANEGWPMAGPHGRQVTCCSVRWATIYAQRVRVMANTYRQAGAARVYWITLPLPRDPARQKIARVVNAAIAVALQPWADQTRIIDSVPVFTPHGYRDAMAIGGSPTIVRQADGIHLNDAGSSLLAGIVQRTLARDFRF